MRGPLLLVVCLAWAGCGDEPRLLLELERPSGWLDPLKDKRLARLSLRRTQGTQITTQEAAGGIGELEVGSVPVDTPFDLRLAAESQSGLMLGLGQALDLTVSDRQTTGRSGGPGGLLTRGSHRSGRARLTHPTY